MSDLDQPLRRTWADFGDGLMRTVELPSGSTVSTSSWAPASDFGVECSGISQALSSRHYCVDAHHVELVHYAIVDGGQLSRMLSVVFEQCTCNSTIPLVETGVNSVSFGDQFGVHMPQGPLVAATSD